MLIISYFIIANTVFRPTCCSFDPLVCGSKQCPYDNQCIAELAGYTAGQCTSPPPTCPEASKDCSGEPNNPYTCGSNRCEYRTICDLESAGFTTSDCCQDTRTTSACASIEDPVSCGRPGGKQCDSTQCQADAAGYSSNQCCNGIPATVACASIYEPVVCGADPYWCGYANQCEATAAGYSEAECCRQPDQNTPCSGEFAPVVCGNIGCQYSNACLAGTYETALLRCFFFFFFYILLGYLQSVSNNTLIDFYFFPNLCKY